MMVVVFFVIGKVLVLRILILWCVVCYDDWGVFELFYLIFVFIDMLFVLDLVLCR